MIRLPPDFKECLALFNAHRVEYLLIGGYAVAVHGYPRATQDLDLWIAASRENAGKVVAAVHEFGFPLEGLREEDFTEPGKIVWMGNPPLRIDILNRISGVEFSECVRRRVMVDIDGVETPVISLADLKTNKQASGRLKDLADLEELPK
jgi:hypothetical protein